MFPSTAAAAKIARVEYVKRFQSELECAPFVYKKVACERGVEALHPRTGEESPVCISLRAECRQAELRGIENNGNRPADSIYDLSIWLYIRQIKSDTFAETWISREPTRRSSPPFSRDESTAYTKADQ